MHAVQVSDADLAAGREAYNNICDDYMANKFGLSKKGFAKYAYSFMKANFYPFTPPIDSVLFYMVEGGKFTPSSTWITPSNGQAACALRVGAFWRCITMPEMLELADTNLVFFGARDFGSSRPVYRELALPHARIGEAQDGVGGMVRVLKSNAEVWRKCHPMPLMLQACTVLRTRMREQSVSSLDKLQVERFFAEHIASALDVAQAQLDAAGAQPPRVLGVRQQDDDDEDVEAGVNVDLQCDEEMEDFSEGF
jgi:hypothetical protein